jgi:hypothetical protein
MSARGNHRPGFLPFSTALIPVLAMPFELRSRHRTQCLGNVRRSLHLLVGKLGILVDVPPPRDHARLDLVGERLDVDLRASEG